MKTPFRVYAFRPLLAATMIALAFAASATRAQDNGGIEFEGSASTVTPTFEVKAPWILDWRIYSDFPQSMSLEMALLDATSGMHRGLVRQTKQVGTGVKLFREGGAYKLRIDSDLARWHVLIREVTEEEAALYTPKEKEGLLSDKWFRNSGDNRN